VPVVRIHLQQIDVVTAAMSRRPYRCANRSQRREGSHFQAVLRRAASTLMSNRSSWLAKCVAVLSAACAAVEKWVKPSLKIDRRAAKDAIALGVSPFGVSP
jgi:hypothetical protein